MDPNTKKLIGAVIAGALAVAVFYGVVSQQQAGNIQNQANQALGTGSAAQQQPVSPNAQNQTAPAPAPGGAAGPR